MQRNAGRACAVLLLVGGVASATPPGAGITVRGATDPFLEGGSVVDNFDSYALGDLCGQSDWEEWSGSIDVCAVVTDEQANSGSQSMKLEGDVGGSNGQGDDTVHQVNFEGGQWTFSCQTFVPEDASGAASLILLNTYPPSPNSDWSVVVALDADLGVVQLFSGELTLLKTGKWVEFRVEIDLDADTVDYFYDGEEFVSNKSWTAGIQAGGLPRIQAIDLYGGEPGAGGTTGTYIDDVSLAPAGGGCAADCNGDGNLNILDFVCYQAEFQNQTDKGDCDGNGDYNILDFVCYQGEFQGGNSSADCNGDGNLNILDFVCFQGLFQTCSG